MRSAHEVASAVRAEPFRPLAWLRTPHGQTLASALMPRRALPPGETWYVETEPGTRVLCRGHTPRVPRGTALVVVHGMGGSSESGHVVDLASRGLAAGLSIVRMNMRNCGGTHHLTPTLYHSNQPQDLKAVVEDLIANRGARRVVVAGYSVGGNLVLNALALWGDHPPSALVGAALLCPAIDIGHCVGLVDRRSNAVYRRFFLHTLTKLYVKKASLFPERFRAERVRGVRTLREFDTVATGPDAGFSDVDALYEWVSAASRLQQVAVPTVVLHAADDPVVELLPSTRRALAANPAFAFVETEAGGHCGFLARPSRRRLDGQWAPDQIIRCALAWSEAPGENPSA